MFEQGDEICELRRVLRKPDIEDDMGPKLLIRLKIDGTGQGITIELNDPTQFEQVDETCEFGGAVLYSGSLDMTAFLGIDAPWKI